MPLATIIQIAPIYVTFAVPQRCLPDLRQALANETATIEAIIPGEPRRATGQVTMIENTVDAPTGMVPVRATMPNNDELLWPGTLVHGAVDVARGGGGHGALDRRPGQPEPAPSCLWSRTTSRRSQPVKVARVARRRIGHRSAASRAARRS